MFNKMELTINKSSSEFNDYLHSHNSTKRNSGSAVKRLQVKRNKRFLGFNKWFRKEHDYCLPIKKQNVVKNDKAETIYNDFEEINKSLKSECLSLDCSNITKNLKEINVNNELSSCSLYAIDVTTELLKDALKENKKKQPIYEQSVAISKDCIHSSGGNGSSSLSKYHGNQDDTMPRLNNENIKQPSDEEKKSCILTESTPTTLFSPTDIDSDMIKLFPTLDYSMEHNLNEKQENIETRNTDIKTISHENTEGIVNKDGITLFCPSSGSSLEKNILNSKCKVDDVPPIKLPNDTQKLFTAEPYSTKNLMLESEQYINIFNRYQGKSKEQFFEQVEHPEPILLKDLLCGSKPKTIISPYTHRYLKPYIFRDPVTKPLWLQMLKELKEYFRRKKGLPNRMEEVETIDYSYVRAKHIKSVNALARQFFWPGIDLTESLLYPDFSVIALYKNLVIGFGFMVPDISTNENYITFLFTRPYWTNSGIATFMIYHLIQTCMTRDITLHVSPDNPAMILYQKFGFKIEEFVQNFYENYIPAESKMSKHALFLRLRSTFKRK